MANPTTKPTKLSGGAWQDIATHTGTASQYTAVSYIVVKNTAIGAARVGIRLIQGSVTTEIAGPDLLDEGGSYRYRLPLITLAGTDKLQANVLGGVDATVGLQVMGT